MTDFDIAIIGAGPAGLTAALYAARFCRTTLVLHDAAALAARIPLTHNAPGFEAGISGAELLDRMTRHAARYGAAFVQAHITDAEQDDGVFRLISDAGKSWTASALIIATGVDLNQIPLAEPLHEAAIASGVLRYCPVCDGFEHRGERIAVVGCDAAAANEALFLRDFSEDITLLAKHDAELGKQELAELGAAGIAVRFGPITRYEPTDEAMLVYLDGCAEPASFDVLYPALGHRPRNQLAQRLGLGVDDLGNVDAQTPFKTPVAGLFCAGDLVEGLDQISVAMGQGAVAATKAHNWLRER